MFGHNINFLTINYLFFNFFILKQNTIRVKNHKHPPPVITVNFFHIVLLIFNFPTITFLSLSCWLKVESALPLLNYKVKVVNSFVKNDMYLNNFESKVFGSRRFSLSKYLLNYWHNIVMTGVIMKPPKYIKYVLVEYKLFLKAPIQMKGCLVMI